jgi:hypothetical protein
MNIGYFFNGYLSDKLSIKSQDSPDGNAWYSSSIIHELMKRGHNVSIFADKDNYDYEIFSDKIFDSFCKNKREHTYSNVNINLFERYYNVYKPIVEKEFDLILLEWRFPIKGRNTIDDIDNKDFSQDLLIQNYILENYNCPIVIFDLDYKLTALDEEKLKNKNVVIFETAKKPKQGLLKRISVEIPFWINDTEIIKNKYINEYKDIVYIGSRYERDEIIKEYIVPYSNKELFKVWFYGNWRKYKDKYDELYTTLNWRNIQYHDRVGHSDFEKIYSNSLCCPLLAKQEYFDNGFMTARIQECLYFGSIPIGFKKHYGIEEYLPKELIANGFDDFYNKVNELKKMNIDQRNEFRKSLWKNLNFMDVNNFVNKLLEVKNEE